MYTDVVQGLMEAFAGERRLRDMNGIERIGYTSISWFPKYNGFVHEQLQVLPRVINSSDFSQKDSMG